MKKKIYNIYLLLCNRFVNELKPDFRLAIETHFPE